MTAMPSPAAKPRSTVRPSRPVFVDRLVLLMGRTSATKDVELLVLRHEFGFLHPQPRTLKRPGTWVTQH
jgi:hypothetical protein